MANLLKYLLPVVISCWAAVPIYGQEIIGGGGQNDTPGGCGDTIHGCDQNGNVYDPGDPYTYFDYEESCHFCVDPAAPEGYFWNDDGELEAIEHWSFHVDFCEWDLWVMEIDFCRGTVGLGIGPFSVSSDPEDDEEED